MKNRKKFCIKCKQELGNKAYWLKNKRCKSCEGKRRKGKLSCNYIDGRTKKQNKCVDCNAKIVSIYAKRCVKCSNKHKSGINHWNYGRHWKDTIRDRISNSLIGNKQSIETRLKKQRAMTGTGNYFYGKHHTAETKQKIKQSEYHLNKNTIITHHIDLNKNNNSPSNKLKISQSLHTSLHHRAYNYLVRKGMIKKYIRWFFRYEIKEIKQ